MKFRKKYFFIVLFISLLQKVNAQGHDSFYSSFREEKESSKLEFLFNYSLGSNCITNDLTKLVFYTGGHIDSSLKAKDAAKLKVNNRYGAYVNTGINYTQQLKRKDISLILKAEHKEYLNMGFSKDFYNVVLYGNKMYAGKTADIDKFSFNTLRYQKYGAGLMWTNVDSVAKLGFTLSYLNGVRGISVNMKKAQLYTANDGTYIDLLASMDCNLSDTTNHSLYKSSGRGVSADIYFEAPYKLKKGKGKIVVSVDDLGFINWNAQSLVYQKQDTNYHFTGVTINNIFSINDSTFGNNSKDSLLKKILPASKKKFSSVTPATLDLYTNTSYGEHFQFVKGLRYIFNANYKPLMYIGANYKTNEKIMFTINLSYGGYTGFATGLGITAQLWKGAVLRVFSNNAEGFIVPKKTTAQAISFGFKQYF